VAHVYHASLPSHSSFSTAKKLLSGIGGVVSFTLKDESEEGLQNFHDKDFSAILKAPTLGSNQTLICPYPMLTHYFDTDQELEEIKLPRHLIRIAAGCEKDLAPILGDLNGALLRTIR
jgi:cystathionine beta-lyase/cystathionine gamma-synthase